jgi:uncharacterized LabA/DUF88 family protein
MTSDHLINVADRYVDLEAIKEDIQKISKPNSGYSFRPMTGIAALDSEG